MNRLLKQFVQMQKMLKLLGGMAGGQDAAPSDGDAASAKPVLEDRGLKTLVGAAAMRSAESVDAGEQMLVIRLRRAGSKKRPFFRVVVTDSRAARDSSFVEVLGHYNPRTKPAKRRDRPRAGRALGEGRAAVRHGPHAGRRGI